MKLTPDQTEVLNYSLLEDWDVLILTGPAGSGKTTLLNAIKNSYNKNKKDYNVLSAALTGRAASVLRTKGLDNARTIHYWIWGRPTMYVEFKNFYKLVRLKLTRTITDNELWLIDESSMLHEGLLTQFLDYVHHPERNRKLGLFGSKLQELYDDDKYTIKSNKKIIFCGDNNQLPPVYGYAMPALDNEKLSALNFKVVDFSLNTLHRHKDSTDIHKVAEYIEENRHIPSNINEYKNVNILNSNSIEEIADEYLKSYNENPYQTKYITYLNQLVHEFNIYIRTLIYKTKPRVLLVEGDLIHVTKNNYYYDLWNGDHLVVEKVHKEFEGIPLPVRYVKNNPRKEKESKINNELKSSERKDYTLNFTRVEVKHTETNKKHNLLVVNETLNNMEGDNWIFVEREDLYYQITEYLNAFFFYRHPEFKNMKKSEYKEELETDEYNNAIYINYSYALTGHKAQGGEWDNTFVDLTVGRRKQPPGWMYTAITRASKKVNIIENRNF